MQASEAITRRSASNLALAFVLLPRTKRESMAALYAFCREVDDAADEEERPVEERRALLGEWRDDVRRGCEGKPCRFQVNQELQSVIREYSLPFELFDELIRGVEMDLDTQRYATYEDLEVYCYRVASVVGLLSIEIFQYSHPGCREYAVHLGKALQLTNILRDVATDAERGRIYLPLSELKRFGVTEDEVIQGRYSERYFKLASSVAEAARAHYRLAQQSLPREDRRSMGTAELMGSVYWQLLERLEALRFNVFDFGPARLSKPRKLYLILRTWYRIWSGGSAPNYGVA